MSMMYLCNHILRVGKGSISNTRKTCRPSRRVIRYGMTRQRAMTTSTRFLLVAMVTVGLALRPAAAPS